MHRKKEMILIWWPERKEGFYFNGPKERKDFIFYGSKEKKDFIWRKEGFYLMTRKKETILFWCLERKDFILMVEKKETNIYFLMKAWNEGRISLRWFEKEGIIECTLTEGGRDDFILMVWKKKLKEESYLDGSKGRKKDFVLTVRKKGKILLWWFEINGLYILWWFERKQMDEMYFNVTKERNFFLLWWFGEIILFWCFKRKIGRKNFTLTIPIKEKKDEMYLDGSEERKKFRWFLKKAGRILLWWFEDIK